MLRDFGQYYEKYLSMICEHKHWSLLDVDECPFMKLTVSFYDPYDVVVMSL